MRKQTISLLLFCGGIVMLASGCVSHVFKEPMAISTKASVYKHVLRTEGEVSGTTASRIFILIPYFGDVRKGWGKALEQASERNCNALIDVQQRMKSNNFICVFPPIYWLDSEVSGTAAEMR